MPADPNPDQLDGEQRFRADLVAYLNSLFIPTISGSRWASWQTHRSDHRLLWIQDRHSRDILIVNALIRGDAMAPIPPSATGERGDGRAVREPYQKALATFAELFWFLLGALGPPALPGLLWDAIQAWISDAGYTRISHDSPVTGTRPTAQPTALAAQVREYFDFKRIEVSRGLADATAVAIVAALVRRDLTRQLVEVNSGLADAKSVKILADKIAAAAGPRDPERLLIQLTQEMAAADVNHLLIVRDRLNTAFAAEAGPAAVEVAPWSTFAVQAPGTPVVADSAMSVPSATVVPTPSVVHHVVVDTTVAGVHDDAVSSRSAVSGQSVIGGSPAL